MLSAAQAFERLVESGKGRPGSGMDDPTEAGYPIRWWFNQAGVLCSSPWRAGLTIHRDFTVPK